MNYILTTQNLTKTYGKKDAAKDINIHVREGEIYGLIGRNGAGKTTVMRVISGLSKATSGSYQLHGENKFGVGVLIESPGIYPNMSAEENRLLFAGYAPAFGHRARACGRPKDDRARRADQRP